MEKVEIKEYYFLWCAICDDWCKIAKNKGWYWKTFNPEWISDFLLNHAGHDIKFINTDTGVAIKPRRRVIGKGN